MKNRAILRFAKQLFFFLLLFQLLSISPSEALFGPKSGSACSKVREERKISGKLHICEEDKAKKLRWLINEIPSDKNAAVGLILNSCGTAYDGEYSIYVYPRMMFGALAERGIAEGSYKPKNKEFVQYDIEQSSTITNNFEMAAALDSKWSRIITLWESGIDAAYSRWNRGGVNQIEAINSSKNNLDSIEGLCKIALKIGEKEALRENRTVNAWITRVVKQFN